MRINLNKGLIFAALFFIAVSAFAFAEDPSVPGDWKGYASINGTIAPDATPVSAHLDGASSAAASTTVGAVEPSTGYYLIHVPGPGTNVTFKICGIIAYPSNNTPQTWSAGLHPQGSSPYYNISVNKQANGAVCTYACGCTGGYCNSNVCASSAPAAATTDTSTGGTSSSTTTVTPAATAKTETPVVKVSEKVTDTNTITELITSLEPSDLGVVSLDTSKVDVVKTGTASAAATATVTEIESALTAATDEKAKQVISEIKETVSSSSSNAVQVTTKLEVYNITSKETNKTSAVSKITLTFTADKNMKNVKLVEVIPKDVAKKVSDVSFKIQPIILQADPIVQWIFDSVTKGEKKDLSYTVNKKLDTIKTSTLAAAEADIAVPAQPQQPSQPGQEVQQPAKPADMTIVFAAAAIVVILALGILFYFKSTKKRGNAWNQSKWKSGK